MKKYLLALFLLLPLAVPAKADSLVVQTCGTLPLAYAPGASRLDTVDINGNKCISGSISASFASFHLTSALTPITATTGGVTSGAFTAGQTIVAFNTGATNTAYCQPGGSASTSSQPIPANSWFAFATTSETTITCVTSTSTTTVNLNAGTGGPSGAGGGSGGGSGGNVTIVGPLGQALAAASIPIVLTAAQLTTLTPPTTITANQGTPTNWLFNMAQFGGSAVTLGQQLAAASIPVILPSATITTLTPPSNTGYSTSANQTSQITQETAIAGGVGTPTDAVATAPASATSASTVALLKALLNVGQYPSGAVAITASATGTTAATTATLAGTTSKTTYICGLSIRANATGAATGNATVTGTITGTLNFTQWTAPLASGLGVTEQIFNPCVPASAQNTGIAIISAAPGSGGVVSSTGWGYQL